MDYLWAALPDELRQLVVAAFVRDATSSDLARVAPLSPAFLTAVRDEREGGTGDDAYARTRLLRPYV